jgi:hypothetical protein
LPFQPQLRRRVVYEYYVAYLKNDKYTQIKPVHLLNNHQQGKKYVADKIQGHETKVTSLTFFLKTINIGEKIECVEKSLKPFLSLLQLCGKDPLYLQGKQNDWLLKNYVTHS